MNRASLQETLALGAATGMRSFSGPAVMAMRHGGPLAQVVPLLAAAELVADKTPFIGNRTDPGPLAGRAVMGALVGALSARAHGDSPATGALVGATVAVLAAHLAFHARRSVPLGPVLGGLAEDAIVMGLCAAAAR